MAPQLLYLAEEQQSWHCRIFQPIAALQGRCLWKQAAGAGFSALFLTKAFCLSLESCHGRSLRMTQQGSNPHNAGWLHVRWTKMDWTTPRQTGNMYIHYTIFTYCFSDKGFIGTYLFKWVAGQDNIASLSAHARKIAGRCCTPIGKD